VHRVTILEKELITFKNDKLERKKLNSPKVSLLAALESINNEESHKERNI